MQVYGIKRFIFYNIRECLTHKVWNCF